MPNKGIDLSSKCPPLIEMGQFFVGAKISHQSQNKTFFKASKCFGREKEMLVFFFPSISPDVQTQISLILNRYFSKGYPLLTNIAEKFKVLGLVKTF